MTGSESSAPLQADARRLFAAFAVLALVTGWLFHPFVTDGLRGHARFFEWDVAEQYWPDLVYLCDALHDGELPTWNPYDRGGYPYYADPQAGTYSPINWAICAVAGRDPSLGFATARVVLGFALAGVFALLWLRRLGASIEASLLGAVLFECAPFMRHNMELNLTTAFAWLPFMLFAAEGLLARRRIRDAVWLAAAVALCGWTGSPPALWLAGSFLGLYLVLRCTQLLWNAARTDRVTVGLLLGLASALIAGFLAPVLIPASTLADYSVQANRSYASIAEGSLQAADLIAVVWPRDGNHFYTGLVVLALIPFALLAAKTSDVRARRVQVIFALTVWLCAILLSLGSRGVLFPLAFDVVPGVRKFRLPYRYEAWIGPCAAIVCAIGFDALRARYERLHRYAMPIAAALATLSALDATRTMASDRHTRRTPAPHQTASAQRVDALLRRGANTRDYRVMDEFGISSRSGTRLHRRDFRGYQDPLMLRSYERIVDRLCDMPELAEQFNVRYALTSPHFIHGWGHHYLPRPEALRAAHDAHDLGEGVVELRQALPFAYFVSSDRVVFAPENQALSLLLAQAPARVAVIAREGAQSRTIRNEMIEPMAVDARHVVVRRDAIEFDITVPARGHVVVNEVHYPGWRAWVDGAEARVERANVLARAVAVTPGQHHVRMRFEPSDARWTRWTLLLTLLFAAGLFWFGRRSRAPL